MQRVTGEAIRKLEKDPLSFAMMMEDREIEHVIVTFVSVLINRKSGGGDQD